MPKLTKAEAKLHRQAAALAGAGRPLTLDEREFVLDHWHEGAEHEQSAAGAFFTPRGLARDLAIEVGTAYPGRTLRVLDLCAGIGRLADAVSGDGVEVTCVERNSDYVAVGRAAVPGAAWICADAFDVEAWWDGLPFDVAVSNPPYGAVPRDVRRRGAYTGNKLAYLAIEVASRVARRGVFLISQERAPFRYSGERGFCATGGDAGYRRFTSETGIALQHSCGIDTSPYEGEWRGTAPRTEVVLAEFDAVP